MTYLLPPPARLGRNNMYIGSLEAGLQSSNKEINVWIGSPSPSPTLLWCMYMMTWFWHSFPQMCWSHIVEAHVAWRHSSWRGECAVRLKRCQASGVRSHMHRGRPNKAMRWPPTSTCGGASIASHLMIREKKKKNSSSILPSFAPLK